MCRIVMEGNLWGDLFLNWLVMDDFKYLIIMLLILLLLPFLINYLLILLILCDLLLHNFLTFIVLNDVVLLVTTWILNFLSRTVEERLVLENVKLFFCRCIGLLIFPYRELRDILKGGPYLLRKDGGTIPLVEVLSILRFLLDFLYL